MFASQAGSSKGDLALYDTGISNAAATAWTQIALQMTIDDPIGDESGETRVYINGLYAGIIEEYGAGTYDNADIYPFIMIVTGARDFGDTQAVTTTYFDRFLLGRTAADVELISGLLADADGDGDVDFADYQILEGQYGTDPPYEPYSADFDNDGDVDFADYQILEGEYGSHLPEPATLALMLIGGLALLRRSRS